MAKANAVCVRCEEPVRSTRKSSTVQIVGLVLFLVSIVTLWPLFFIGLLMMIFGGAKRICPSCRGDQLVPLDSAAARRIIQREIASQMAGRVVCEKCGRFGGRAPCEHCGNAFVHAAGTPAADAILGRQVH